MKCPAYPKYKPSGVEWLGDVPEHWEVKRLRYLAQLRNDKTETDEEMSLPYVGMENIESWTGRLLTFNGNVVPTGISNRFRAGALLFGKLRPYLAKACVVDFSGLCSSELLVLETQPQSSRFLLYQLLSDGFISLVDSTTYGAKMPRASWDFIGDCELTVPPQNEQVAIADFLDAETAKLDTLVAKKRELIEKLKEKRSALISRTVTRGLPPEAARADGLNPHPKFKPSGIEWLGEIPEHWEVSKIRFEAAAVSKGTTPSTIGKEVVDEGIRFIKAENIQDGKVLPDPEFFIDADTDRLLARSRLKQHDILVVIAGATTGKAAVLPKDLLPANTNQAVCFIRLKNTDYAPILAAWMSTKFIQNIVWNSAVQAAQPNLAMEDIKAFPCLIAPLPEQYAMAHFLEHETSKIDRMVAKVEAAIERLQEYRTALITAAVTGKIDVRAKH
ncbi:MAG: restriction endonuclease subunit S [Candidatus Omnitrophica bacterium]|nr:restriction endonuclease subunit S [Candidatus Omnitrophota bacterium]